MEKSLASPGYYLQQNDIVYVEPNEKRKRETTVNGNNAPLHQFLGLGGIASDVCCDYNRSIRQIVLRALPQLRCQSLCKNNHQEQKGIFL